MADQGCPPWVESLVKTMVGQHQSMMEQQQSARDERAKEREERALERERQDRLEKVLAEQVKVNQQLIDRMAGQDVGQQGQSDRRIPNAKVPPELSGEATLKEFNAWVRKWEDYVMLTKVDQAPNKEQLGVLRSVLSPDMHHTLVHRLEVSDKDEEILVSEVIDRIRQHIRDKRNVAIDRFELYCKRQRDGESFNEYYVGLQQGADDADLCEKCKDETITTLIMVGVKDQEVRKKLLKIPKFPKLHEAVTICETEESAKANNRVINKSMDGASVNKTKKWKNHNGDGGKKPPSKDQDRCSRCARAHGKDKCPAKDWICHNCGSKGHSAACCSKPKLAERKCKSVKVNKVETIKDAPKIEVSILTPKKKRLGNVVALPDSGSEATIAGMDVLDQFGIKKDQLQEADINLTGVNQHPISCVGKYQFVIELEGRQVAENVYVCPGQEGFLMSWFLCRKLGILPDCYPKPFRAQKVWASRCENQINSQRCEVPNEPPSDEITKVKKELLQEFADVFTCKEELQAMEGEPMKIHLKDGAKPFALYGAREIAFAHRAQVKEELDKMVKRGVIEPVGDEPSEWCHPLVVVIKKNGSIRITTDLTKLNDQVKRPFYPTPNIQSVISGIGNKSQFFSTLDAKSGYWQVKLDKASKHLTTFITPWGRFRYLRTPMGFISTGDEYCRRGDIALKDLPNLVKVIDDILIHETSFTEHVKSIKRLLQRCREHKITLNPEKFEFAKKRVPYVGYIIGRDGIEADPKKVDGIAKFPVPKNRTELKSFMGLAQQLASFSSDLSKASHPLRSLMSTKNEFVWLPDHTKAFEEVKATLLSPPVLAQFDPEKETFLQTDASRCNGLGYALLQKHGEQYKLVQCGSRYISETEARYAMIELELLAIVWSIKKCKLFLAGLPHFMVITDHRPLLSVINHQTLDTVENPRLQRLKEKLSMYNFTLDWQQGSKHCIPDALSRSPVADPTKDDLIDEESIKSHVQTVKVLAASVVGRDDVVPESHLLDKNLEDLKEQVRQDAEYQTLFGYVSQSFPKKKEKLPEALRFYWKIRHELSCEDELVLWGNRIVIPRCARPGILAKLHSSHQGIEKTKRRAKQTVFWPGITSDVTNVVDGCLSCQEHRPSQQKEPLLSDPLPKYPFQETAADLFEYGTKVYLVYVDRLSGWTCVHQLGQDTSTTPVVKKLQEWFADYGVPQRFRSDGGPQFKSAQFRSFVKDWGIEHVMSTPHYAQSNGLAESAVKSMKKLIIKTTEGGVLDKERFLKGLIEFRNAPRSNNCSPAQEVFGRETRTLLPRCQDALKGQCLTPDASGFDHEAHYNKTAKPLPPLSIGDKVFIQDTISKKWSRQGVIVKVNKYRDYKVKLSNDRLITRNRRFLKLDKTSAVLDETEEEVPGPTDDEPRRSSRERKKPNRLNYSE